MGSQCLRQSRETERGSTLLLAAFALIILLGMAALAIDVATLYVARTEAQRAADAAALAGATVFVNSGCTNSLSTCGTFQLQARKQAQFVGNQNEVFGQNANIADVSFSSLASNDPLVQVTVRRSVPTFLAGALLRFVGGAGSSSNVVAKATAEAFNPSVPTLGPDPNLPFFTSCLKPWGFLNQSPRGGQIVDGQGKIDTRVIGISQQWQAGTDFKKVSFAPGGGSAQYRTDIETCNPVQLHYDSIVYPLSDGTAGTDSVNTLIHDPGQDTVNHDGPPFRIMPGSRSPFHGLVNDGIPITTSQSVVSVPLYNTCAGTCRVVGFMQLFIEAYSSGVGGPGDGEDEPPGEGSDRITATILNVAGSSSAGTPPVVGGGPSLLPVRLIQNQ